MKTSERGIQFIKSFEAFMPTPYKALDYPKTKKLTIGYGHLIQPGEKFTTLTEPQACDLLADDLVQFERDVTRLVKVAITQDMFDALVSFAYNCGADIDADTIAEGLGDSTLLKKLNSGDFLGAADEFLKWCKCNGVEVNGLKRRRTAERDMFLGDA